MGEDIKTVGPTGGATYDYSSLAAWEAGEQGDITATGSNVIAVAECYPFVDSNVIISGWTTDATHYIEIRAAAGYEAGPVWGTGCYQNVSTNERNLNLTVNYLRVKNLQFKLIGTSATANFKSIFAHNSTPATANYFLIKGCHLRINNNASVTSTRPISLAPLMKIDIINNIGYEDGSARKGTFVVTPGSVADVHMYNNSAYGFNNGYDCGGTGTVKIRNCIANNIANECFQDLSGPPDIDYCASDTNAYHKAPGVHSVNGATGTAKYVAPTGSNPDFRLKSSDTACRGRGIDLSNEGDYNVTDDFIGNPRPNVGKAVDIGPFEKEDDQVLCHQ